MSYFESAKSKLAHIKQKSEIKILSIESSCDETAAAITINGNTVLCDIIASQIDIHKKYGGVVPEIASRHHTNAIVPCVEQALQSADLSINDIDAIGVTYGPGLVGSLLIGVSYAKALAFTHNIPLVGVHHIEGHICAAYLEHQDLKPPFIALVVSGGHSHIVLVLDNCEYKLLGRTRDDAAGEAYDKVARVLGLPYPGGVEIDRLYYKGDNKKFTFNSTIAKDSSYDFSFSGIKTGVINIVHNLTQKGQELPIEDIAASFQEWVVGTLCDKTIRAALDQNIDTIVVCGGVASNSLLRSRMLQLGEAKGKRVIFPSGKYCTDNAAMIGAAAYKRLLLDELVDMDINANPGLKLF